MGRQSQLVPKELQFMVENRPLSAHSLAEQFEEATAQIFGDPALAHPWALVLRSFGPALLQEARKSISYGQTLVKDWSQKYMFAEQSDREVLAEAVPKHFGGSQHGIHGSRIGRNEARHQRLNGIDLEENQCLQEEVTTLYHLSTIALEMGPTTKSVMSSNGRLRVKNT